MDRRKSLLVNLGEVETDAVLREVAEKLGVRVFAKPRLADVLNIDRSGLTNDEYRYALSAHLDFVVADEEGGRPHFAVEFDGPYHKTDRAALRRDGMKNAICERLGLPLLRIDADFLRRMKGFRLLAWLVELWFLDEAFYKAQHSGYIPWDEPFNPWGVIDHDENGRWIFTYDLSADARQALWRAYEEGRCLSPTPDHLFRTTDDAGEAYAMLPIARDQWLISHVRIRAFRFPPVTPGELADDLAVVDVAAKLEEFERGATVAAGPEQYAAVVANLEGGIRSGWSFGFGGGASR